MLMNSKINSFKFDEKFIAIKGIKIERQNIHQSD